MRQAFQSVVSIIVAIVDPTVSIIVARADPIVSIILVIIKSNSNSYTKQRKILTFSSIE